MTGDKMRECVVVMNIPTQCGKCPLRKGCKDYQDWSWYKATGEKAVAKPKPLCHRCLIRCILRERHGRLIDASEEVIEDVKNSDGKVLYSITHTADRLLGDYARCFETVVPATKEGGNDDRECR